jgi:hypothetical protein
MSARTWVLIASLSMRTATLSAALPREGSVKGLVVLLDSMASCVSD